MGDPNSDISVSAILVTCNSAGRIVQCLSSLVDEIVRVGGEIIIFDNDSHDSTVRAAKSAAPMARIFESRQNIGFAAAVNKASELAGGRFLLFLNPDVIIDRKAIETLNEAMGRQSRPDAMVGRMRNPDGSFQPTCRNIPTMGNIFFSRGSFLTALMGQKTDKYTLGDFQKITEVPAAAATCMIIEREFFRQLGGFDSRFFLFMEDTDLCLRIGQLGGKVYFVPEAGGVHFWGQSSEASVLKRSWHHHMSLWRYFLKHYPNGFSVFLLPIALMINFLARLMIGSKFNE